VPANAGAPPDPELLQRKFGPLRADVLIYIIALLVVPTLALLDQHNQVASAILFGFGGLSLAYVVFEAFRSTRIERERLFVVLILTVFFMIFSESFEQAGSSMNNFTDRNIDRVFEDGTITSADAGKTI